VLSADASQGRSTALRPLWRPWLGEETADFRLISNVKHKDIGRQKPPQNGEQAQLTASKKGKKSLEKEEEREEGERREVLKQEHALGSAAVKSQTKPRRSRGR
jgi:hypothetical protein